MEKVDKGGYSETKETRRRRSCVSTIGLHQVSVYEPCWSTKIVVNNMVVEEVCLQSNGSSIEVVIQGVLCQWRLSSRECVVAGGSCKCSTSSTLGAADVVQ